MKATTLIFFWREILHSLKLFEKTHKGKIDVIYIDNLISISELNEEFDFELLLEGI